MVQLTEHEKKVLSFGTEKYLTERDEFDTKNPLKWLEFKQFADKLSQYKSKEHPRLWRIHDDLYDLSSFQHPGGNDFLEICVDTDITELFESSHPNIEKVRGYLGKYRVETSQKLHPRFTEKFTFDKDGFYCVLRDRVFEVMKTFPKIPYTQSVAFVHDTFLVGFLFFTFLALSPFATGYLSFIFAAMGGILLACLANTSHNFWHMKDNWRVFTFDLSLFSSFEWRLSHAYSHHTFPNTILDVEIWGFEPFIEYIPYERKAGFLTKIKVVLILQLFFPLILMVSTVIRFGKIVTGAIKNRAEHWIPFVFLGFLVYLRGMLLKSAGISSTVGGNFSFVATRMLVLYMVCSKVFLLLGLAGAHHHPSVWHAGDNTPEQADQKMDWGIFQLIAVGLRPTVDNNLFLTSISFGRHALHHMFPTIDHAYLNLLNPTFEQTCRDFGILDLFPLPIEKASPWAKRRYLSLYEGWIGMIRQGCRSEKNIGNFPALPLNPKIKK